MYITTYNNQRDYSFEFIIIIILYIFDITNLF